MSVKIYCDLCGKEIGQLEQYKTVSKTTYHKTNGQLRQYTDSIQFFEPKIDFSKDLCIDCYNKEK